MQTSDEYKEKLAFLVSAIPILSKCTKLTRDRVCRSFRLVNFPAGSTIFKEGEFLK